MRRLMVSAVGTCLAVYACGGDDGGKAGDGTSSSGGSGGSSSSSGGSSGGNETSGSSSGGSNASGGSGGSGGSGASGGSAGSNAGGDAGEAGAAGASGMAGQGGANDECTIGEAQNPATPDSLDLFGAISYYSDGLELPAGRYRVELIDGCMKYASNQDWTIHAYEAPGLGWFLGAAPGDELVRLPGTVGYSSTNGAYADFEDCVDANLELDPVEFDFAGGMLGVWLKDSQYTDNLPGLDGRNPVWELVRLGACED